MGDSNFSFPLALKWDLGPDRLRNLKNKLLLHFQSKKRSNGGECEIQDSAIIQGYVLIHFKEQEVRDSVLQKETQVLALPGGKTMQLEVKPADAAGTPVACNASVGMQSAVASVRGSGGGAGSITPESSSNVVLMKNVLNSCSSEMLNLLVENISEMTEDKDFYVEMIPEIHCATVTFTSDIDVCSFIEKLLKNPRVRQLDLKAEPLERTRTIRAEGLPPNTSADHLIIYFESPKHGGGRVNKTKMLPEEEAALVTFTDAQTVAVILSMTHTFGKKPISVFPYYPCYDIALYGRQILSIDKPQPCTFPISPYILEFILSNADLKHNIEENMMAKHCEIIWPNLSSPSLDITLSFPGSLATHLRTMVKIVRTWKEEVSTEFSLVISRFKVIDCKVTPAVWEAIKEQVSSSSYRGVFIKANLAEEKVFLAGILKDVTRMESSFRELVEETTRHIERKKRCVSKPVAVSPVLYQIMRNSGQEKKILDETPELEMKYDVKAKAIILTGVQEEVLSAKAEILDVKHELKSKTIHLNQHIVRFLMSTDNEELSILLFVHHHINALVEMEENAVKLTGYSKKDLTEAEEQINREIIYRQIPVTDKKVLEMPEWKSLYSHLCESYNAERCAVLIEEFPMGAEQDVVVTGLITPTLKCYQEVHDFLETNSPMQRTLPVKSPAILRFIKQEKKKIWDDVTAMNVQLSIGNRKLSLIGTKLYVEKAASLMERVLSSVYTDTLYIDKPGAKKFCMEHEEMYITWAKSSYKCLIYLQKEDESDIMAYETSPVGRQCQIALPHGMILSVYKGDLCRHHVDVIVNAANEDLKHIGGLALAILKAAGPKLQVDSDDIVRRRGSLSAGDAVVTDAGDLSCKQIIHTVGPRWDSRSQQRCEQLLHKAVIKSLELASEHGHRSIAIPAVSSGIFGFPLQNCAQVIVKSIKEYVAYTRGETSLKDICLMDTNDETIKAFTNAVIKEFGEQKADSSRQQTVKGAKNSSPETEKTRANGQGPQITTNEGITIRVQEGLLQDAATDVIVNSVGKDLHLDSGGASKALSMKAGRALQESLLDVSAGSPVQDGSVFITDAGNLSCNIVIHVVVPKWDGGKGSSEKVYREIIASCLDSAEQKQLTSITFPAIGTGVLGFPRQVAAAVMTEEILLFSKKQNIHNVQEVNIMLHPNDQDNIQDFSKELNKRRKESPAKSSKKSKKAPAIAPSEQTAPAFFGPVNTLTLGVHEMKIGSITYQVKTGDITKEDTDVIVNSTDQKFALRTGVSKAILEAAGQSVIDECVKLGSQANVTHLTTNGGNLLCKKILHIAGRNSAEGIKEFLNEALNECAKLQASSVAFPAIGTGLASVSAPVVADIILEAVTELAKSKLAPSLQTVKVVIFQQQMLNDFYSSMKRKEGSSPPKHASFFYRMASSFMSLFTSPTPESEETRSFELKENIEPAIFHLCAEREEDVHKTSSWLRDLILKEQHENTITDDWIQEFDDQDHQKLVELQKKLEVFVSFRFPGSTVTIRGLTRDVLEMTNKLQAMINNVRDKKTREREAELCGNLVEWRYNDGKKSLPFDLMTNMELEKAKNEGRAVFNMDVNGAQYKVLLEIKEAIDAKGNTLKLERVPKHEQLSIPGHWEPMNNQYVKVVLLAPGSQEYSSVEVEFRKTCQMKIIKIERIQNESLWINYQIKKQSIDTKNQSATNEKQLFHGTDAVTITTLNTNGFNRSYAGRNAACYGNGTYFAIEASYSAHDQYSKPDANGQKYMYLARVVTGISCPGQRGMVAPPPKNQSNPTDLYDSVTDNPTKPQMYVIFHDIQAYPEYLITFSK